METFFLARHRRDGHPVVFSHVGAGIGGKDFGGPNLTPTLAANPLMAMRAGGEIPGVKGQGSPTDFATL